MTYLMLKSITSGLLTGDNVLPKDDVVLQGLVQYALTTTATKADSLHLMTLSTTADVLRLAQGDYLIRMPGVPAILTTTVDALVDPTPEEIAAAELVDIGLTNAQVIDIDEELTFAVCRFIASYVSKAKGGIHVDAANRIILDYNAKTYEITEQMQLEAAAEGLLDACDSTVFSL